MGVDAQTPVHRVQQQTFRHDSQLETSVHAGRKNQCHVVSPSFVRTCHAKSPPYGAGSQRRLALLWKTRSSHLTTNSRTHPKAVPPTVSALNINRC